MKKKAELTIGMMTDAYRQLERHAKAFDVQLSKLEEMTSQVQMNARVLATVLDATLSRASNASSPGDHGDEWDGIDVPTIWKRLQRGPRRKH